MSRPTVLYSTNELYSCSAFWGNYETGRSSAEASWCAAPWASRVPCRPRRWVARPRAETGPAGPRPTRVLQHSLSTASSPAAAAAAVAAALPSRERSATTTCRSSELNPVRCVTDHLINSVERGYVAVKVFNIQTYYYCLRVLYSELYEYCTGTLHTRLILASEKNTNLMSLLLSLGIVRSVSHAIVSREHYQLSCTTEYRLAPVTAHFDWLKNLTIKAIVKFFYSNLILIYLANLKFDCTVLVYLSNGKVCTKLRL